MKDPKPVYLDEGKSDWKRGHIAQQDLTEPRSKGIDGYRFISTIFDEYSGTVSARNCRHKVEALHHAAWFLGEYPYVTQLRVDGAGE